MPAALSLQLIFGPLQAIVSLLGAALGVIVHISLRFAVVDDMDWRTAWSRGWALARSRVADVLVVYLIMVVLGGVATAIAATVFGGATVGCVFIGASIAAVTRSLVAGAVFGGIAGLAAFVAYLAFCAGLIAWTSSVWTVLWRRLANRDPQPIGAPVPSAAAAGASE